MEIRLGDKLIWRAHPKQEAALLRPEDEILYGGARGGGKTAAGIAWLLMGNPVPTGTIADDGYFLHPNYRALVLRKNINDMGHWIDQAKMIYGPLGAEYTSRPCEFKFDSGAKIIVGHLDDQDAYEKYQGQEYARILIEELTQIPSEDLYKMVLASNRCPYDELRRQVFITANPGGPGHSWVRERFVVPAPPNESYKDPKTGKTRIFIPAGIKDNPIYAEDRQYISTLLDLSPMMRRAWLEGDWDAIAGQYFDEFRLVPNRELNEPENARHVRHSTEAPLLSWYHRWLAVDWGYTHNSATYKFCSAPDGRVHVYDELVVNHTTPEDLGMAVAQFIWTDLQGRSAQKAWQLFLSPDAFGKKTDERTVADQLAVGIEKVLGVNSVYILPVGEEGSDIFSRAGLARSASVMIQRAANQRVPGWMHMKSLMRWQTSAPISNDEFDPAMALKLHRESAAKYNEYMGLFAPKEEILPKLVIHGDKCPKLVRAIPLARANDPDKGDPEDVKKVDGDDEIDACRYGLFAMKANQLIEPFEEFYAKRLNSLGLNLDNMSGGSKVWVARKAEEDYKALTEGQTKPIYFNPSTARARRHGAPKGRR